MIDVRPLHLASLGFAACRRQAAALRQLPHNASIACRLSFVHWSRCLAVPVAAAAARDAKLRQSASTLLKPPFARRRP
jgi:hypothetical protein